jgi:hypothetical protein
MQKKRGIITFYYEEEEAELLAYCFDVSFSSRERG